MRVGELEGAKQFGRNGNLTPALGAALQGPDPDRGGLEEAPGLIGGEVLAAAGVDELKIADQARYFALRRVRSGLIREILEHSRIVSWLEENLIDDRRPGSVVHSVGNPLRTCLVLLCQGHRDQDDADRLRHDPAVAAAAKSSGGPVHGDGRDGLPSQPRLSRFVDQLSCEENLDVLKQGILSNGLRRIREECRGSEDFLAIDVDDVPFLADSHQPGSRYCCYSALVAVSGESGDILGARLRRPEEDKAEETFDFVLIVAGALEEGAGAR